MIVAWVGDVSAFGSKSLIAASRWSCLYVHRQLLDLSLVPAAQGRQPGMLRDEARNGVRPARP